MEKPLELSHVALQKLLDAFVDEYLYDKSIETKGTYRRSLNEFERWFAKQKKKVYFRKEDIERYKAYLMDEKGLHQVSVSTYLTAVRRFCQFLVDIGKLEENPALKVKGNRRPSSHSRKVLTLEEVKQLLDVIPESSQIFKRDNAIIHMMLYAGLGEIEIVRANMEDLVQQDEQWYLFVQGKGRTAKDQQVQIAPNIMDKIRIYLDTRTRLRPEDPLFASHGYRSEGKHLNTRSVRGRINHHLKSANLKRNGITPHSLTHTAALIWLKEGLTLEEVKERMRHGMLETTMIYFRKQGLLNN